jgi:hypothetical protein
MSGWTLMFGFNLQHFPHLVSNNLFRTAGSGAGHFSARLGATMTNVGAFLAVFHMFVGFTFIAAGLTDISAKRTKTFRKFRIS